MAIQVFGTLAVDGGTTSLSRRDRIVLAALATRPGQVFSRDQLVDALWGDSPPASSRKVLQGCVVRLRKEIGQDAIQTAPPGYRLAVALDDLDVGRFEQLVLRARELLGVNQFDRAAYVAQEALTLWRGRPFADGAAFISSGDGGVTALWDPVTGELLDRVVTEPDVDLDAAFLDDASTLRIASPSGLYRADMALEPALEAACRAAGRSMTRAEWELYVGDRPYRETCP